MGTLSIWHILLIAAVALLLLGGRGKISGIMGDTAKGIRAFREGLKGEEDAHEEEPEPPAKPLPKSTASKASASKSGTKTASRSTAKSKA